MAKNLLPKFDRESEIDGRREETLSVNGNSSSVCWKERPGRRRRKALNDTLVTWIVFYNMYYRDDCGEDDNNESKKYLFNMVMVDTTALRKRMQCSTTF